MSEENFANLDIQTSPAAAGGGPGEPSFYARYKRPIWATVLTVAAAVAVLLVYVFFFRNQNNGPVFQGQAQVTINAPQNVPSGSQLSYQITIADNSNTKLTGLQLELVYPHDFTFSNSTPQQETNGLTFTFPDLGPGQEQKLTIVGRMDGAVAEIKTLKVRLHYVPENFRSSFITEATADVVIVAPDITFKLQAAPQLVTGQTINYQIVLTNVASRTFSDLQVNLTYPNKFQYSGSAIPLPTQNDASGAQWAIASLGVGQSATLSLSGRILDDPGQESFAQAELLLKNVAGDRVSAGRSFVFTQIQPSPLVLTQRLVKSPDQFLAGESLSYEVDYENTSEVGLNNVVISVVFQTPVFDFSKLTNTSGQLRGSTLVWIPGSVRELLVVSPHQKGALRFDLPISDQLVQKLQKNPHAQTAVQYYSRELAEPIAGNTLDFRIQTQTAVAGAVSIVSGPNPPVPGQTTTYQIDLTVTNGVNDLTNAQLLATIPRADITFLPDSVSPAEEQSNVQFIPLAGRFSWNLNQVFAFSGTFHDARHLSFRLNYTPTIAAPPQDVILLQNIQVSGRDEFAQQDIVSNQISGLTVPRSSF